MEILQRPFIPLWVQVDGWPLKSLNAAGAATARQSIARWYDEIHGEGGGMVLGNATRQTASDTTLATKLAALGPSVSEYVNGAYVAQGPAAFIECEDLETNHPLSIHVYWGGSYGGPRDSTTTKRHTLTEALSAGGTSVKVRTVEGGSHNAPATASTSQSPPYVPNEWPYWVSKGTGAQAGAFSADTANCVAAFRIEDEWVQVTAKSFDSGTGIITLTVRRGIWGTSAIAHGIGVKVMAPVYIGNTKADGPDGGLAGNPIVNNTTKGLRYAIKLWRNEGIDFLIHHIDRKFKATQSPEPYQGYDAIHFDVSGPTMYNHGDAWGHPVVGWHDPSGGKVDFTKWGQAQAGKFDRMRLSWPTKRFIANGFRSNSALYVSTGILASVDDGLFEKTLEPSTTATNKDVADAFLVFKNGYAGTFWLRWNRAPEWPNVDQGKRFSLGILLLAYRPGSGARIGGVWKSWDGTAAIAPDKLYFVNWGTPSSTPNAIGDCLVSGSLYKREYSTGVVVVNFGTAAANFTFTGTKHKVALNGSTTQVTSPVSVPAKDAVFLQNGTGGGTGPPIPPREEPRVAGTWVIKETSVVPAGTARSRIDTALGYQGVVGFGARIPWNVLETADGVFNDTLLNNLLAVATAKGRKFKPRFMAGQFTPTWARGSTLNVGGTIIPAPFSAAGVPNATLRTKWERLVKHLFSWARAKNAAAGSLVVPMIDMGLAPGFRYSELWFGPEVRDAYGNSESTNAGYFVTANTELIEIALGAGCADGSDEMAAGFGLSGHGYIMVDYASLGGKCIAERLAEVMRAETGADYSDRCYMQANGWAPDGREWGQDASPEAQLDAAVWPVKVRAALQDRYPTARRTAANCTTMYGQARNGTGMSPQPGAVYCEIYEPTFVVGTETGNLADAAALTELKAQIAAHYAAYQGDEFEQAVTNAGNIASKAAVGSPTLLPELFQITGAGAIASAAGVGSPVVKKDGDPVPVIVEDGIESSAFVGSPDIDEQPTVEGGEEDDTRFSPAEPLVGRTNRVRAYKAALATSHRIKVVVSLFDHNEDFLATVNADVIDGQVDVDTTRDIERSLSLTLADTRRRLSFDDGGDADTALYADRFIRVDYAVWVHAMREWHVEPVFFGPITRFERDGFVVRIEGQDKSTLMQTPIVWGKHLRNAGLGFLDTDTRYAAKMIRAIVASTGEQKLELDSFEGARLPKDFRLPKHPESLWGVLGRIVEAANTRSDSDRYYDFRLFYDGRGRLRVDSMLDGGFTFSDDPDAGVLLSKPQIAYDLSTFRNTVVVKANRGQGSRPLDPVVQTLRAAHPLSARSLNRNNVRRFVVETIDNNQIRTRGQMRELARSKLRRLSQETVDVAFDCLPIPFVTPGARCRLVEDGNVRRFHATRYTLPLRANSSMAMGYLKRAATGGPGSKPVNVPRRILRAGWAQ